MARRAGEFRRETPISPALRGPRPFALSCPANLLLQGEYAVLEEGGQGICLAPSRRAWLFAFRDSDKPELLTLRSRWPGRRLTWTGEPRLQFGEVAARDVLDPYTLVLGALKERLGGLDLAGALAGWNLLIDTSPLFRDDGRKLGLGSSAASLVLAVAAVLRILTDEGPASAAVSPALREEIRNDHAQWMVELHRRLQGGRGSGYDVLTSLRGGLGHFTGGARPVYRPLDRQARLFPRFHLLAGPEAVKTVSSIGAYLEFKEKNPRRAGEYLEACRTRAAAFAAAKTAGSLTKVLKRARSAGIDFGKDLGVPADFELPLLEDAPLGLYADDSPSLLKSLGAGNETALLIPAGSSGDGKGFKGLESFSVDPRGLLEHRLARGFARAKLLLFGEHSALYGSHALGLSLDETRGCEVLWTEEPAKGKTPGFAAPPDGGFPDSGEDRSRESGPGKGSPRRGGPAAGWELGLLDPSVRSDAKSLLDSLAGILGLDGRKIPRGVLEVETRAPDSGGFGSSAALSAALVLALRDLYPGFRRDIWEAANRIDSFFHGKASGIDTGLALRRGLWDLAPRKRPEGKLRFAAKPLGENLSLFLLYAGLPRSADTKTLVASVKNRVDSENREALADIETLGAICLKVLNLLKKKRPNPEEFARPGGQNRRTQPALVDALGAESKAAQARLRSLGLSTPELDRILAFLETQGSPGAKLSGGGGGGAFYAWAKDEAQAEELSEKLGDFARREGLTLTVPPTLIRL